MNRPGAPTAPTDPAAGTLGPVDPAVPTRVPWREVMIFLAVAFGAGWVPFAPFALGLADLPSDPLDPLNLVPTLFSMLGPSLAVLVVTGWVNRPPSIPAATGLVPLRPWPRQIRFSLLALVLFPALAVVTLGLAWLLGRYHFDLTDLSGLSALLHPDQPDGTAPVTAGAVAGWLAGMLGLFVAGLPFMFGEEWGWRGYLGPRLLPLGFWPMAAISGAIWGFWHLPVAFVPGRNPAIWLPAYIVSSVLTGTLLHWLRLRARTVWPAVLAHGTISTFPCPFLPDMLADAAYPPDPLIVDEAFGWVHWLVTAAVIALLVLTRQLRPRR